MMRAGQITKLHVDAPYQEAVEYVVICNDYTFSSATKFDCNTYILFHDEEPVELPLYAHEHKVQFKIP